MRFVYNGLSAVILTAHSLLKFILIYFKTANNEMNTFHIYDNRLNIDVSFRRYYNIYKKKTLQIRIIELLHIYVWNDKFVTLISTAYWNLYDWGCDANSLIWNVLHSLLYMTVQLHIGKRVLWWGTETKFNHFWKNH